MRRRRHSTASARSAGRDGAVGARARHWRDVSTATFLSAYREAPADRPLMPADPAQADRLLRFFLMEKALYEIDYELANRPAWLHVPLAGALRILRPPEPEQASPHA